MVMMGEVKLSVKEKASFQQLGSEQVTNVRCKFTSTHNPLPSLSTSCLLCTKTKDTKVTPYFCVSQKLFKFKLLHVYAHF